MRFFRILVRILSGRRTPAPPPVEDSPFRSTEDAIAVLRRSPPPPRPRETILRGQCWVIDGDTLDIAGTRIRLAGIDAPELDHPWGQKAKWAMVQLCKGQTVTARIRPELSYDRVVAECFLPDGRDLAAELVRSGLALDWPKFSGGKYRHLEPVDARKRLWRAQARQQGRPVQEKR
ncbi:thermonuclease family protein [Devosia albogilva]|uniref:Thermonuclease family protein n=1 Tax=Devosia albogilva TaxID=429726 RepID=A0ABW5QG27_9HYPH